MDDTWKLQDAKAKFSELVNSALKGSPQVVTKHGEKAVVIIAYDAYNKLQDKQQSLKDLFANAPKLSSKDLPIARDAQMVQPSDF